MYLFKVLLFQKPAVTLMIGRSVNSLPIHLNFKLPNSKTSPKSSSLWDISNSTINVSSICFFFSEVWWSLPCFREPQFSQLGSWQRLESGLSSSILIAAFAPQRNFFLQWWSLIQTHNWSKCREKVTTECPALVGKSILYTLPRGPGITMEEGAERL